MARSPSRSPKRSRDPRPTAEKDKSASKAHGHDKTSRHKTKESRRSTSPKKRSSPKRRSSKERKLKEDSTSDRKRHGKEPSTDGRVGSPYRGRDRSRKPGHRPEAESHSGQREREGHDRQRRDDMPIRRYPFGKDSDWVELETPNGQVYYYNERTNKTQWDPPQEAVWEKFVTDDGVPYWFNRATKESVWKKPNGIISTGTTSKGASQRAQEPPKETEKGGKKRPEPKPKGTKRVAQSRSPSASASDSHSASDSDSDSGASRGRRKGRRNAKGKVDKRDPKKKSKAALFEELLDEKVKEIDITFDEAMKDLVKDERYKALSKMSDRRIAFLAWKESRRPEFEERDRAIKDFMDMLNQYKKIKRNTPWEKVRSIIGDDSRFLAVKYEAERERLFEEWLKKLPPAKETEQDLVSESSKASQDGADDETKEDMDGLKAQRRMKAATKGKTRTKMSINPKTMDDEEMESQQIPNMPVVKEKKPVEGLEQASHVLLSAAPQQHASAAKKMTEAHNMSNDSVEVIDSEDSDGDHRARRGSVQDRPLQMRPKPAAAILLAKAPSRSPSPKSPPPSPVHQPQAPEPTPAASVPDPHGASADIGPTSSRDPQSQGLMPGMTEELTQEQWAQSYGMYTAYFDMVAKQLPPDQLAVYQHQYMGFMDYYTKKYGQPTDISLPSSEPVVSKPQETSPQRPQGSEISPAAEESVSPEEPNSPASLRSEDDKDDVDDDDDDNDGERKEPERPLSPVEEAPEASPDPEPEPQSESDSEAEPASPSPEVPEPKDISPQPLPQLPKLPPMPPVAPPTMATMGPLPPVPVPADVTTLPPVAKPQPPPLPPTTCVDPPQAPVQKFDWIFPHWYQFFYSVFYTHIYKFAQQLKQEDEVAHQTAQKFAQQAGFQYARHYARQYSASPTGTAQGPPWERHRVQHQLRSELQTFLDEKHRAEEAIAGASGEDGEGMQARHVGGRHPEGGARRFGKSEKEDEKDDGKAGKRRITKIVMIQSKKKKDDKDEKDKDPKEAEHVKEKEKNEVRPREEEWREVATPDGARYYYNAVTRETRWDRPNGMAAEPVAPKPVAAPIVQSGPTKTIQLGPWVEYRTPEGRYYYYNTITLQTSWQTPDAFRERNARHRLHCACAVCCHCARPRVDAVPETTYQRLGQQFQKNASSKLCFQHKQMREVHELELDGWTGRFFCLRNSKCKGAERSRSRSQSRRSRSRSPSLKRSKVKSGSPRRSRSTSPKKAGMDVGNHRPKEGSAPPPAAAAIQAIAAATPAIEPSAPTLSAPPAAARSQSHTPSRDRSVSRKRSRSKSDKGRSRSRSRSRTPKKGRGDSRKRSTSHRDRSRSLPRSPKRISRSPVRGRGRRSSSRGGGGGRSHHSRDRRPSRLPFAGDYPPPGGSSYLRRDHRDRDRDPYPPRSRGYPPSPVTSRYRR